jgi:hypothetical protein
VRRKGAPPQSASFPTLAEARRWAKIREGAVLEGRHFPSTAAKRYTLADLIDRPAPALPEAPVSITRKAMLNGHEVMVTLRGHDFASVKAQMEQASQWLQTQDSGYAPQSPRSGWCALRGVQMQHNHKEGRSWWSHWTPGTTLALAEGTPKSHTRKPKQATRVITWWPGLREVGQTSWSK